MATHGALAPRRPAREPCRTARLIFLASGTGETPAPRLPRSSSSRAAKTAAPGPLSATSETATDSWAEREDLISRAPNAIIAIRARNTPADVFPVRPQRSGPWLQLPRFICSPLSADRKPQKNRSKRKLVGRITFTLLQIRHFPEPTPGRPAGTTNKPPSHTQTATGTATGTVQSQPGAVLREKSRDSDLFL